MNFFIGISFQNSVLFTCHALKTKLILLHLTLFNLLLKIMYFRKYLKLGQRNVNNATIFLGHDRFRVAKKADV